MSEDNEEDEPPYPCEQCGRDETVIKGQVEARLFRDGERIETAAPLLGKFCTKCTRGEVEREKIEEWLAGSGKLDLVGGLGAIDETDVRKLSNERRAEHAYRGARESDGKFDEISIQEFEKFATSVDAENQEEKDALRKDLNGAVGRIASYKNLRTPSKKTKGQRDKLEEMKAEAEGLADNLEWFSDTYERKKLFDLPNRRGALQEMITGGTTVHDPRETLAKLLRALVDDIERLDNLPVRESGEGARSREREIRIKAADEFNDVFMEHGVDDPNETTHYETRIRFIKRAFDVLGVEVSTSTIKKYLGAEVPPFAPPEDHD